MWTRFMDMHSGGGAKEDHEYIIIEAPMEEAKVIFYNRFGHNPERVTCTCCGDDYSISEDESLEQITAYNRGCDFAFFRPDGSECPQEEAWVAGKGRTPGYTDLYVERQKPGGWSKHRTLEEYLASGECLLIRSSEIKPEERRGQVPEQGYVWID